ncbi:MAG: DUF975 family protein [Clostridiaceae bacterium]|nr:DUF975 family protein [Clostridiaceae bacterium]
MTIKEIKSRAKNALKQGCFWSGYGVNITFAFINSMIKMIFGIFLSLGLIGPLLKFGIELTKITVLYDIETIFNLLESFFNQIKIFILSALVLFLVMFVIKLLFTNVLTTGKTLWFSRNREQTEAPAFSRLFNGFKKKSYGDLVKGMAWRDLWQIIWQIPIFIVQLVSGIYSFVVVERTLDMLRENYINFSSYNLERQILNEMIPNLMFFLAIISVGIIIVVGFGIIALVKKYSYRATAWILADNPNICYSQALQLSKDMTQGFKGKWFVLDLSFIGWYILLLMTLPLMFFTRPLLETYVNASYAEFYAYIRDQAVRKGLVTMEELGYVAVQGNPNQPPMSAADFYQTQGQFVQPAHSTQPNYQAQSYNTPQPYNTAQPYNTPQPYNTAQPPNNSVTQPDDVVEQDDIEQKSDFNDNN